ncbi:DUF6452 family protein [Chitinophaga cymbidii]|uniref:Uncharacterized protein n=1 Tax=Chitinophaga cymbidii TaxID=1096750 RepID=A0A512RFU6_9BACT|nr:DUF6452 family protein [Chitinophaga cymbidii]GEP94587.1 hypothetical protein CCY01nite_08470 [Chitinophaga cymbidii]
MRYALLMICALTCLAACDDDTKVCDVDVRTELRANFRYVLNNVEKDTTMPKVTLYAFGKEDDSIYAKNPTSGIQFSLDRTADSSRFYFQTDSTRIADTLIFRYRRQPHFVSAGCGFATYFTLDTIIHTTNVLQSIQVRNHNVTTGNETNLTFHF